MTASATLTVCAPEPAAERAVLSSAQAAAPAPVAAVTTTIADGLDAPRSIAFHGQTALVSERAAVAIAWSNAMRRSGPGLP